MQYHELIAEVDVLLGGRAAEKVFIKEISTGASNDLERATDILKAMVSMYGMSEVAGLMVLEKQRNTFLGGQSVKDYSEKTAQKLDESIKEMLSKRFDEVVKTMEIYSGAIENMVAELYKSETIEGAKVREIISKFEEENNLVSRLSEVDEDDELKDIKEAKEKQSH